MIKRDCDSIKSRLLQQAYNTKEVGIASSALLVEIILCVVTTV